MQETLEGIPAALLDVELERIAASGAFRRAPLQYRLLAYLVDRVRAGEGARLKESAIAVDVIGRAASRFDGSADTSVRVAVRRLRQRLARYYAEEGAWAAVEIVVPVGSYAPQFQRRVQMAGPKLPSIAVLPFRNFTGDAAEDAFCDGLAEEITDALAQVAGVKIVSRTSAFQFRGDHDARAVGAALGVATLLEGSVQRQDGRSRVVVQWVRCTDGYHAWSHAMDADAGESADALKPRVAREVVAGLQRRLLYKGPLDARASSAVVLRRSRIAAAQALYEDARYLMRAQSGDGYRRSIAVLREAIAADPRFAVAMSALACALVNLIGLTLEPPAALLAEARTLLERALALDPQLGEAHAAMGFIACAFDRDWPRAERAHLRAIRCAPSLCYAHSTYGWGLMVNGRFADADAQYRFARELDPLDLKIRAHHALVALYAGDDARAIETLETVLALEPRFLIARALLATAHLWRGDYAVAREMFAGLAQAYPSLSIGEVGLAQVEAETGEPGAARARLAHLAADTRHCPPYQLAMVHARLGDVPQALQWLERSATTFDMNFVCAPVDRTFSRLRSDPAFVAVLERHGLRPLALQSA